MPVMVVVVAIAGLAETAQALEFPAHFNRDGLEVWVNYDQDMFAPETGWVYARIESSLYQIDQAYTNIRPYGPPYGGSTDDFILTIKIGGIFEGPLNQVSFSSGGGFENSDGVRGNQESSIGGFATLQPPYRKNYGSGFASLNPANVDFYDMEYQKESGRWSWEFNFGGNITPEPTTASLFGFGLGSLPFVRRRRI